VVRAVWSMLVEVVGELEQLEQLGQLEEPGE
jgi:hypothetical protein